jgi:hypothetical protein
VCLDGGDRRQGTQLRSFQMGTYGRIKRRDVTAAEWIRRHVPQGTGAGLLVTIVGLLVVPGPH